ncbi:MAG: hypothetical protein VR65_20070 [Desulfobulbaceae bacterium BRH_c16a]|nr:MAG: hypothetical protein VR65_20070 [Desulfobulbaceae bacterium BRH_c16a]
MKKLSRTLLPLLLLALLLSFGCAKDQHTYITPGGHEVKTSDIGLQTMAIRDQNIGTEDSYNKAIKGASDIQAVALMANKLTSRGQQIEREATASEEARAWAGLFLRYFGGGIDVMNNRKTVANTQVYNIKGNNNNMSGVNNTAHSEQGDVNQSLSSQSTPYEMEANQTWSQQETQGSANGAAEIAEAEPTI